ncbi:MAG: nucleoside triphosphate pyrophosphohydrolase [Fimbriimonas sp.]
MVLTLRLEPGPISEDVLAKLRDGLVFVLDGDPATLARLAEAGIAASAAPEELPNGARLVLARRPVDQLAHICDRLLGPGGCPWDQAQTHESLKKHLIEEAYEVLDAIDSGSSEALREELGDLLLQPVLHAQMRRYRTGEWGLDEVAESISEKLVRRHPHVFGSVDVADADEVLRNWDRIKQTEKGEERPRSVLAGVPRSLPALLRAFEVSKRAVRVGFEWPDADGVLAKLQEEANELREAIASGDQEHIESELGDLLFTVVNIARWAKVEPEEALRKMVDRFTRRFMTMEALATKPLSELTFEEWDALWEQAKKARSHG